jgi:hypothetical protein
LITIREEGRRKRERERRGKKRRGKKERKERRKLWSKVKQYWSTRDIGAGQSASD